MGSINRLTQETANLIAAGEVVERPASVVKELVENSFDAGASAVTVEIRGGGIDLIRITDNGCGMDEEDAKLCFERHATSKIRRSEDLAGIVTMGFRGEALASVAAVAKVRLQTRKPDGEWGTLVEIDGGEMKKVEESACPEGTTIWVEQLFYNTPARLKFLKRPISEAAYVSDYIVRLILTHPEISIRYVQDNKTVYHSPGNGKLLDAIYTVYGRETTKAVLPVDIRGRYFSCTGFLGTEQLARANRTRQTLIINHRYVRDPMITMAVESAYRTRIMANRFPFFVLCLDIDAQSVDVNVHPNKLEVRIENLEQLREELYNGIIKVLVEPLQESASVKTEKGVPDKDAVKEKPVKSGLCFRPEPKTDAAVRSADLLSRNPIPLRENPIPTKPVPVPESVSYAKKDPDLIPIDKTTVPAEPCKEIRISAHGEINAVQSKSVKETKEKETPAAAEIVEIREEQETLPVQPEERTAPADYRIAGVLFSTYLMIESGETVYCIDQHAAHERLLYERYLRELTEKGTVSQAMLVPPVIHLTHQEKLKVIEQQEFLADMGFDVEDFGADDIRINAVPMLLGVPQTRHFFEELLDRMGEIALRVPLDLRRERIMQMACKHAVKAGDRLEESEIRELMVLLREEQVPLTCPHGRPILLTIRKKDMEKRFGRIQ